MKKEIGTLALGIALLPPIWAVLAPHIGVTTGAVALICAGLYVANGNKLSDALKISLGFLCGDIWAILALWFMDISPFNPDLELFITLFVMGGLAVLISSLVPKYIYCPSWLCGWAIGLTIMAPVGLHHVGTLPIEIGVAMLVGVWYVGAGVDKFQRVLLSKLNRN
jgi:hypothetical protein